MDEITVLMYTDISETKKDLYDNYKNLSNIARHCEDNYIQNKDKEEAIENTKELAAQSLGSVSYQIHTLSNNFLQLLDLQSTQFKEMESQVNYLSQKIKMHQEKVSRREIGVLTVPKSEKQQYKIIKPSHSKEDSNYVRKPINYTGNVVYLLIKTVAFKITLALDYIGYSGRKQNKEKSEFNRSSIQSTESNFSIFSNMTSSTLGRHAANKGLAIDLLTIFLYKCFL